MFSYLSAAQKNMEICLDTGFTASVRLYREKVWLFGNRRVQAEDARTLAIFMYYLLPS
jgi:hypothetical protein